MKSARVSNTDQVVGLFRKRLHSAVSAGAEEALEVMQREVPVDHGDLGSTLENNDDGKGHAELSAGGKSQISDKIVDYAEGVEFGTAHETEGGVYNIPAQPFFRPGIEAGKKVIKSKMKK